MVKRLAMAVCLAALVGCDEGGLALATPKGSRPAPQLVGKAGLDYPNAPGFWWVETHDDLGDYFRGEQSVVYVIRWKGELRVRPDDSTWDEPISSDYDWFRVDMWWHRQKSIGASPRCRPIGEPFPDFNEERRIIPAPAEEQGDAPPMPLVGDGVA